MEHAHELEAANHIFAAFENATPAPPRRWRDRLAFARRVAANVPGKVRPISDCVLSAPRFV